MSNQQIAELLRNVAAAYTIKNERKYYFQIVAYQKAADAIDNSTTELIDLYKQNALQTLSGVGPSIKAHLEELLKTGNVTQFKWVFKDIPDSVFPLLKIPSFGPKKASSIVRIFHFKNPRSVIEDLEKTAKQGKIAPLAGFGEKSEKNIIRSISEFKLGKTKLKRMTLPYATDLAEKLVNYLKKSKYIEQVETLGSLRRKSSTIGDIDIAVATNNPKEVIKYFVKYPFIERVVEKGDISSSILVSGGHQIDLMTQSSDAFGSLLQHFTGSKAHNIHLREYALKKGLSLSEYGIKNSNTLNAKLQKYKTEKEFYNAVGMNFIPPELREDNGEIELAIGNELPKLVELSDIKGDLHIHSDFPIEPSHDLGKSSINELLNKAKELNYEYLAFSEHNPSMSRHNEKQIKKILEKRDKKLEKLKSSNKTVRIIKLLEVDILPSGKLAVNDNSLKLLDGVIVSIHSSFSMNIEKMTKRVLTGLSHPRAKILGHPTGRLINERLGFDLEWDKIFEFCIKNNKALEINSWPNRLDLPDTLVRKAVQAGVKLVINSDSHAAYQMNLIKHGVSVARRGWAKKSDILNTLPYNDFRDWLSS
ncbi:MAG: DNA polymerase/3'-5' exonuclease PolX [Candidatus Levyibacteriota bacterium]